MKDNGGMAFPCSLIDYGSGPTAPDSYGLGGMSLRDYFAGQAIEGLLGKYSLNKPEDQETITRMAYQLSDAMLAERNKE